MKFGLSNHEFEVLNKLVIDPLKKQGLKVYVFGSRAKGKHHQFSDIDIMYVNEDLKNISSKNISEIKESIEESNFPIKVDLVNWDDLAYSYKPSVLAVRILV